MKPTPEFFADPNSEHNTPFTEEGVRLLAGHVERLGDRLVEALERRDPINNVFDALSKLPPSDRVEWARRLLEGTSEKVSHR